MDFSECLWSSTNPITTQLCLGGYCYFIVSPFQAIFDSWGYDETVFYTKHFFFFIQTFGSLARVKQVLHTWQFIHSGSPLSLNQSKLCDWEFLHLLKCNKYIMDLYEKTYFIVNVFSVTRSTINAVDTLLKKISSSCRLHNS